MRLKRQTAAIATALALTGLGGIALESNHGIPVGGPAAVAGKPARAPIVTGTSGGSAIQSTPVANASRPTTVSRIVTRTSGAPATVERDEE